MTAGPPAGETTGPTAPLADAPHDDSLRGRARYRSHPEITQIAGEDLGRIVSLSDGVFAFAMTLLVLSLVVPSFPAGTSVTEGGLVHKLWGDWPTFLGYAFAFIMIAIWWIVHNRTYQYIARFDSGLVWINMILLMQIAVMPFVLGVYTTYSTHRVAVDLFAGIQVTLGLTTTGLWEYAQRKGLSKANTPPAAARYFTRRGYLAAAVFAVSIGISFVSVEAAQISWAAIFFVQRMLTLEGD